MYHFDLINSPIAVSPHGSFEVNQLCESVAICEAKKGDRHNKVQQVMEHGDPGMGIFTLGFNRESSENGVYYTVSFDWRERESSEEKEQLELIATFMSAYKEQLIDIEGTRDLTCVDGWTAQQLQAFTAQRQELT